MPSTLWIAGAVLFIISWEVVGVDLHQIFSAQTAGDTWRFVYGLFPPDLSPAFLRTAFKAAVQTLATAIAATVLSIAIGMPLGILASAHLWRRGVLVGAEQHSTGGKLLFAISRISRGVLGFVRAVPDILWAILFVTMFGLGVLPGTLALALAYSGLIGQVFSDVFDAVNLQSLEALQSTGASRLQIFMRGMLPQSLAPLTAYALYSFECCVRAASVLGLVGAGGIGYEVSISMRLFEYGQVLTLMLTFIVLMATTDAFSHFLRTRVTRRLAGKSELGVKDLWIVIVLLLVCLSFYLAGFNRELMDQENILQHAFRFVSGMIPPDFSGPFIYKLGYLVVQTLAIAVIGTAIGVIFGAVLAVPATASIAFISRDATGHHRRGEQSFRFTVYWSARLALNFLRAIPELVWVLICILVIGIGPSAGAIAIGLHTAGVLGKLYAEAMEEIPRAPIEALYAVGATPFQVLVYGIWPQAKSMLFNYTSLRWEANLRISTILGLVGGGGLGQAIYNDIQLGFYQQVMTMILVVYALVMASDWAGDRMLEAKRAAI
jgi:phosphonate transport system permease protein